MHIRVECGFFYRTEQVKKPKVRFDFISPIPNFRQRSKFSFSKIPRGPNFNIFFVKIGTKLPFTLKYKRRNTILKFDFQKVPFWTPQKVPFLVFEENSPPKHFLLCFGFDSALKTIDAQVFFWLVFLKTDKKKLLNVKNAFLAIFGR